MQKIKLFSLYRKTPAPRIAIEGEFAGVEGKLTIVNLKGETVHQEILSGKLKNASGIKGYNRTLPISYKRNDGDSLVYVPTDGKSGEVVFEA